jgi:hypothetical protein
MVRDLEQATKAQGMAASARGKETLGRKETGNARRDNRHGEKKEVGC